MPTRSSRTSRAEGMGITRLTDGGADSSTARILFPYNGSPIAEAALDVAAEWAIALRANAWVLYVRPWDTSRGGHYIVETQAEARAVAAQAVVRLRARGISASGVIRSADRGRIAQAILAEANALDVRMIMLATRARGILGTALLGSTSRSVARRAARPVVLVRAVATSTS